MEKNPQQGGLVNESPGPADGSVHFTLAEAEFNTLQNAWRDAAYSQAGREQILATMLCGRARWGVGQAAEFLGIHRTTVSQACNAYASAPNANEFLAGLRGRTA